MAGANLPSRVCHPTREERDGPALPERGFHMWLGVAILFLIAWLIAYLAFHVVVAAIHILLVLFVVFLIIHFVRRAAAHA